MTSLADAERLVERARRRLTTRSRLRAGCGGLLAGSLVAVAAWAACAGLDVAPRPLVLAALPLLGAAAGALAHPGTRVSRVRAALTLDRVAATDEAFVSALTAERAPLPARERAAGYGLARCASLRDLLPIRAPCAAPAAALATALLAAVLVVPTTAADPTPRTAGAPADAVRVRGESSGTPGGSRASTPAERARALVASLEADEQPAATAAASVRRDVPALRATELEELARTLAALDDARGEAARAALEALARGDTASAERALDRALAGLGGASTPVAGSGNGTDGGALRRAEDGSTPVAGGAASWPLRYDREVRLWFEAQDASSGLGPGGDR